MYTLPTPISFTFFHIFNSFHFLSFLATPNIFFSLSLLRTPCIILFFISTLCHHLASSSFSSCSVWCWFLVTMVTMTVKDEWVRAAMTDDNVVVELLVRLKQAQAAPPAPKSAAVALKWGIRQPRSRPMSMRCDAKRDGDFNASTRRSPTTPLSWSGGGGAASPSAADGFEETSKQVSRLPPAALSRSKGTAGNETTSTTTKRSRRKKTFAELKEEENMLLKERVSLKKELASMRATCKEQRARNDNLKRMKLDLNLQIAKNDSEEVLSSQPRQAVLPDLNMMPVEDDSVTETLYNAA